MNKAFRYGIQNLSHLSTLKNKIKFIEVGPRDGLQNEKKILDISTKSEFIQKIFDSGMKHVEVGSFVNYKKVPALEGTKDVILNNINNIDKGLKCSVLVPTHSELQQMNQNFQGKYIDEVVFFISASDSFNKSNINGTIEKVFSRFDQMKEILPTHIKLRGSISCVFGCPFEGQVSIDKVYSIIDKYCSLGATTIDICDTIGVATPEQVETVLSLLFKKYPASLFSLHFHDTNGLGVTNIIRGVEMGITSVQGSIAGIGGCPFSPKKAGNVDSYKVIKSLHENGYETDIDLEKLEKVQQWILSKLR